MRTLTVHKKAYTRKAYKRKAFTIERAGQRIHIPATEVEKTHVPATTFKIRDIGAIGRGKKVIKEIRVGLLKREGYAIDKPTSERQEALRRADRKYGSISLFRKLQAQVVLRKRIQPRARKVFEQDRDFVKRELLSESERREMTERAREARLK